MEGSPDRQFSTRFSRYFSRNPPPGASRQSPMNSPQPTYIFPRPPPPAVRRVGTNLESVSRRQEQPTIFPVPRQQQAINNSSQPDLTPQGPVPDHSSTHPLLRPGANNNSAPNVPLDQIGLAISAELPGEPIKTPPTTKPDAVPKSDTTPKFDVAPSRPRNVKREVAFRPDSVLSEETVFEEDDAPQRRRSSKLLPTPPIPVPPIRSLQPSRQRQAMNGNASSDQTPPSNRQPPQQPELFLDIPVRHSRPLPKRITPAESTPQRQAPTQSRQLGSPIQMAKSYTAYRPPPKPAHTPELSMSSDIPDYYFTAHQPKYATPGASPTPLLRQAPSPKLVKIKTKPSYGSISRATSRASRGSTNIRDSISSQTSFETVGTNDPTPEDEDDKRLSRDKNRLSAVAESPIHNLRYPKVPRASNQFVPRSPRNSQSPIWSSPWSGASETPSLLTKRRGEREALQLEGRLRMGSPNRAGLKSHAQYIRQHLRSSSVESWSPSRGSERSTRSQNGQWPKSPLMYEMEAVRPLQIRARPQEQQPVDINALKSPAWVPRLTPTRQGDDLLISVTYSKPGQ